MHHGLYVCFIMFLLLREETCLPLPCLSTVNVQKELSTYFHIPPNGTTTCKMTKSQHQTKLSFHSCFKPLLISDKPLIEMPPAKATKQIKMLQLFDLCKHHVENYIVCSDMATLNEKKYDKLSKAFQHQFKCHFDGCQQTCLTFQTSKASVRK